MALDWMLALLEICLPPFDPFAALFLSYGNIVMLAGFSRLFFIFETKEPHQILKFVRVVHVLPGVLPSGTKCLCHDSERGLSHLLDILEHNTGEKVGSVRAPQNFEKTCVVVFFLRSENRKGKLHWTRVVNAGPLDVQASSIFENLHATVVVHGQEDIKATHLRLCRRSTGMIFCANEPRR